MNRTIDFFLLLPNLIILEISRNLSILTEGFRNDILFSEITLIKQDLSIINIFEKLAEKNKYNEDIYFMKIFREFLHACLTYERTVDGPVVSLWRNSAASFSNHFPVETGDVSAPPSTTLPLPR